MTTEKQNEKGMELGYKYLMSLYELFSGDGGNFVKVLQSMSYTLALHIKATDTMVNVNDTLLETFIKQLRLDYEEVAEIEKDVLASSGIKDVDRN